MGFQWVYGMSYLYLDAAGEDNVESIFALVGEVDMLARYYTVQLRTARNRRPITRTYGDRVPRCDGASSARITTRTTRFRCLCRGKNRLTWDSASFIFGWVFKGFVFFCRDDTYHVSKRRSSMSSFKNCLRVLLRAILSLSLMSST